MNLELNRPDIYAALWLGALRLAAGHVEPFPVELGDLAAEYFALFPPRAKALARAWLRAVSRPEDARRPAAGRRQREPSRHPSIFLSAPCGARWPTPVHEPSPEQVARGALG